jgi:hypothetical protein
MTNKAPWLGFIPERLREEIEGDLLQRFQRDVVRYGNKIARRKLFLIP